MGRSYLTLGNPLLFTFGEQGGEGSGELLLPGGLRSAKGDKNLQVSSCAGLPASDIIDWTSWWSH